MRRVSNILFHPAVFSEPQDLPAEPPSPIARAAEPLPPRSESVIDERIHEEMEMLRRWIDLSVRGLADDPILRQRHSEKLQYLGDVSRTLGQLSRLIAAADREEAVARLDHPELKARLQRRPIGLPFESRH